MVEFNCLCLTFDICLLCDFSFIATFDRLHCTLIELCAVLFHFTRRLIVHHRQCVGSN